MSAGLCPLLVSARVPFTCRSGQEDTAQLNAHQPQFVPDPREKALPPRTVRAQTHVRKITLACILQHSEVLHPGGHWRHRSGSGGWWTAQEAIHSSELEPRLFRRLVMLSPYGMEIVESCLTCRLRVDRIFCDLPPAALQAFEGIKYATAYPQGAVLLFRRLVMLSPYGMEIVESCLTCRLRVDRIFCDLPPAALQAFEGIKY